MSDNWFKINEAFAQSGYDFASEINKRAENTIYEVGLVEILQVVVFIMAAIWLAWGWFSKDILINPQKHIIRTIVAIILIFFAIPMLKHIIIL